MLAQIEKIEVVAADLPGLKAQSGIFEGLRLWADLRKQASLNLFGDFDFLILLTPLTTATRNSIDA